MPKLMKTFWPALACLLIVAGMITHRDNYVSASDPHVVDYHANVNRVLSQFPRQFGDWDAGAEDLPLDDQSRNLIKPNVFLRRIYVNQNTGKRVHFLFYQCDNARYMSGHYPPICYPNAGWKLFEQSSEQWVCSGRPYNGKSYDFRMAGIESTNQMLVDNLIILPNGKFASNNHELSEFAELHEARIFGVAQIQILFYNPSIDKDERDQIVKEFLTQAVPAIDAIQAGIPR